MGMRGWNVWVLGLALAGGSTLLTTGCVSGPVGKAEIHQVVGGLNNPESVAFSADGKWLFVTNCASAQFGADKRVGFVAGEASISKPSGGADGTLSLVTPTFVDTLPGT